MKMEITLSCEKCSETLNVHEESVYARNHFSMHYMVNCESCGTPKRIPLHFLSQKTISHLTKKAEEKAVKGLL